MASPAVTPNAGGSAGAPQGGGAGGVQGASRQVMEEFRQVAMQIQMLAQKYPEFSDTAAQILPMLVKGMTQVAGNPARTPATTAPPVGA